MKALASESEHVDVNDRWPHRIASLSVLESGASLREAPPEGDANDDEAELSFSLYFGADSDAPKSSLERFAVIGKLEIPAGGHLIRATVAAAIRVPEEELFDEDSDEEGRRNFLDKYAEFAIGSIWGMARYIAQTVAAGVSIRAELPPQPPDFPRIVHPREPR